MHGHMYICIYRIRSLFGSDFNLAVWRFFFCLPSLNNANIVLQLLICIAATAFRQIKVMPATITNQFAKYLTRQ